ncbi:cell division protein FtsK/SpoIIIE [Nitrobacter hamburgensis X14]|uniref:Cell division protein FtsK/SpoIIIE n=1 Tax=Nitrobacter hamburgensis (strain DSM 10229 / NCIMB 13809 / X14) TaxID=323097 RepID=Q1QGV6_NITHX|nr:FtsK/SpoIIIE domain-containing protein [Nitrobacter hamburgensis]ABE64541.1 cell division protein FtsK/SpoIIIE [Nitrobacter hamburgensis X14]
MLKAFRDWIAGTICKEAGYHPLLPHAYWDQGGNAPNEWENHEFKDYFSIGSGYSKIDFLYCLPFLKHRPSVVRVGGGGQFTGTVAIQALAREAQRFARARYEKQTVAAILSWQQKVHDAGQTLDAIDGPVPAPPLPGSALSMDQYWSPDFAPEPAAVSFQAYFDWPEDGSRKPLQFRCYLPLGSATVILTVNHGATGHESEAERHAIFAAASKIPAQRFAHQIAAAITRYWAARELEKFSAAFRAAVEADTNKVIAEFKAGRHAQLRDWLNEMKPAPRILAALGATGWPNQLPPQLAERVAQHAQIGLRAAGEKVLQAETQARKVAERAAQRAAQEAEHARKKTLEAEEDARRALERAKQKAEWAKQEAQEKARMSRLEGRIPLAPPAGENMLVMGTRVRDGFDFVIPLRNLQHTLVAGVNGSGKSVMLHSLLWQLERLPGVEKLFLVDLKGGVEFIDYIDCPKAEIISEYSAVVALIDRVMVVLEERQRVMLEKRWKNWRLGRIFVVIDEYAELQSKIDTARSKEDKPVAERLSANLEAIARRARALGVVLVCSLQKPTLDAMSSAVRANLNLRLCFRMTNAMASSVLDSIETGVRPSDMPPGRFYYYDSSRGEIEHLQGQIKPGLELAEDDDHE